jgi:hypothetical protein
MPLIKLSYWRSEVKILRSMRVPKPSQRQSTASARTPSFQPGATFTMGTHGLSE